MYLRHSPCVKSPSQPFSLQDQKGNATKGTSVKLFLVCYKLGVCMDAMLVEQYTRKGRTKTATSTPLKRRRPESVTAVNSMT